MLPCLTLKANGLFNNEPNNHEKEGQSNGRKHELRGLRTPWPSWEGLHLPVLNIQAGDDTIKSFDLDIILLLKALIEF